MLTRKTAIMGLLGSVILGYYAFSDIYNRSTTATEEIVQDKRVAGFRAALAPVEVPDSLEHLPNLRGQGFLRDMREAAVLNKPLQDLLLKYLSEPDSMVREKMTIPVLDAWIATSGRESSLDRVFKSARPTRPIRLVLESEQDSQAAALLHRVHTLEIVTGKDFFRLRGFDEAFDGQSGTLSLMSGAVRKKIEVELQGDLFAVPASEMKLRPMQTKYVENAYTALVGSADRALKYGRYQNCLKHPTPGFEGHNIEKMCRFELIPAKRAD